MELKLIPSILSADFAKLAEQIKAVEQAGADMLHIDSMDNHYVPNLTIGPVVVECIRKYTKLPFDVHLMTEKPESLIKPFIEAGANLISIHYETCTHLHQAIHSIKKYGAKAGIVLNPATPLCSLEEIIIDVDFVLIMSVNPGFPSQPFIKSSLKKIKSLRNILEKNSLSIPIEVDGGIKYENVEDVIKEGANWIVIGSGIFSKEDPYQETKKIKELFSNISKRLPS